MHRIIFLNEDERGNRKRNYNEEWIKIVSVV